MRVTERIELIDKLGRTLQSKFGFDEIAIFLTAFDVEPPEGSFSSKWVYSKQALGSASDEVLIRMADELSVIVDDRSGALVLPPKNWDGTSLFRLFVSHISKDKLKATRLRECLKPHGIMGFVAHEDIHPTLEWQSEIERALITMDGFIAVHTPGFSASTWTQQEVGFAVARGVKIISFKMGEDPTGFISRRQALARQSKSAEEVALEISELLAADAQTADRLAEARGTLNIASVDDEIPF